jgi:hypothetical protein
MFIDIFKCRRQHLLCPDIGFSLKKSNLCVEKEGRKKGAARAEVGKLPFKQIGYLE